MKSDGTLQRELSIVTWGDVRTDVLKVNEELSKIIDEINPGHDYKFVKATYLYGDIFVKKGVAQLPSNDELVPISHFSIDKKIKNELSYNTTPLFLSLDKANEFFFDTGKRIIPVNIFHKGEVTSVYETMDYIMGRTPEPIWNYSAGARSIFMLPKVTDKFGLKKLHMLYNIPSTTRIKQLSDHWEIFKSIAQNKNFSQNWQCTILYFGRSWFDNKHGSKEWKKFKDYLFRIVWDHANYSIDKLKFSVCWESFAEIISARRLQPKPYIIDQVKHLLSIVTGNYPAFSVIGDSQESAPTAYLKKVFIEDYSLKEYLPTLMRACMLRDKNIKPHHLYYSLAIPTILEGSPLKKTTSTIISDLREMKLLIETLKNRVTTNQDCARSKIIQNVNFDYFHYKSDVYNQVRSSDNIPIEDETFLKDKILYPNRDFCPTSPFFSGCIRLEMP